MSEKSTSLSLIYDFSECMTILYNKAVAQPYIKTLIKNQRVISLFGSYWLSLSKGNDILSVINDYIIFGLYWLTLGIFSSIGLGTGLQTGVLFVFPEIISRFNENKNAYISDNGLMSKYNQNLTRIDLQDEEVYSLIYKTYYECLLFVLIWGVGTALGELPPYMLASTVDMKDAKSTEKLYDMLGDNRERVKSYIDSTVYYLKKYSFLTILGLSAWPNALFDMCGVASGLVRIPMIEFLLPTIIGKAFIKNPIQLGVILYSFGFYGEAIISRGEMSYIYIIWIVGVILFTLYFIKGAIENIVNSN